MTFYAGIIGANGVECQPKYGCKPSFLKKPYPGASYEPDY
jgi:hypothetical protein